MSKSKETLTFVGLISGGIILSMVVTAIPPDLGILALVVALLAMLAAIIGFSATLYYYLFEPFRRMKNRSAVISNEDQFFMSPSGSSILQRSEDGICATAFIIIPIYRSSTEMTDEEKFGFSDAFSKLLNVSREPLKICSLTRIINKDSYIERIRSKMDEVDGRYNALISNKDTPKAQLDRIKGETAMWHNLLANVTAANSKSQILYAMVSQVGSTEEEAMNLVNIKAQELSAGISAALGVTASVMSGEDILSLIEPEYTMPPATISELMKSKTRVGE
ncbi:MAG: hypothetical protein M1569_00880 [Candidatus Marsarchaeota archaeon]|nr:hypothetical protein [Candidatus Marsarchaeota archaeon]